MTWRRKAKARLHGGDREQAPSAQGAGLGSMGAPESCQGECHGHLQWACKVNDNLIT